MKKVLIVAYYFPPVAASGAMRPLAFCRFLESFGWSVRVLTTDPVSVHPPHPVDPQLAGKLSPGVRVEAVPHGNPVQRLLAWRDRVRAVRGAHRPVQSHEPTVIAPTNDSHSAAPGRVGSLKTFLLDWGFAFPDQQCAWLKPAVAAAKQWPQADIPDVVFATGGPWTSLLVGKQLAEYWKVPLIADYRDPWTSNPYVSFDSAHLNAKAKELELSVCRTATRVITNTHELRAQLENDYPAIVGKTLTITNGFDPESFGSTQGPAGQRGQAPTVRSSRAKLEIGHFGTVYGKRTPVVLLQALSELYQAGVVSKDQLCLKFVGAWDVKDARCEELAQGLEKVGLLRREPPVPYQACLQRMSDADALLVIQPDSPLQIPSKIYEYIATRRPLLLVGGEGATANLVLRHRLGVVCPNVLGEIQRLVATLVDGSRELPAPSQEEIDRFNYRSLTGDLARVLDEVHQEQAVSAN